MHDLDAFVAALYEAVPSLPAAMRAEDEPAEPDHEIPTAWLGHLGPRSRAYVDEWDQFTLGRSSL